MAEAQRYPYSSGENAADATDLMPYLPFTIERAGKSLTVSGLLDTGATVNVLPFNTGHELGAVWEQQTTVIKLGGNLARQEARGVLLDATVAGFAPVRLAFA